MGVAAVWAVGLGFLRSGAALGRAVEGLELAAGLRDAGAVGAVPLAAGPIAVGPIAAAGVEPAARRGAVDGVVVVPTGPLLLLGLDAVVMRQSPPLGTMWKLAESSKLAVCGWWERCSSCRPAPSSRFGESK